MPSESVPLSERVSTYFQRLSQVATALNSASDELGQSIREIDAALKGLNLGVETWVTVRGSEDPESSGYYWFDEIGYAKLDKKWGVALRSRSGNYNYPEDENREAWLFGDAPRTLRIQSVNSIPDLLLELIKAAEQMTKNIKGKTGDARELAAALTESAKTAGRK